MFPIDTNTLISELNGIRKHGLCKIISCTEPKLLKKSREDKMPLPEQYKGLNKLCLFVGSVLYDYSRSINNQLERLDKTADFQALHSKVSEKDSENGIIRRGINNPSQKYVRIFISMTPNNSYEEIFLNSKGEIIEVTKEFKGNYFPKKSSSNRQAVAGIEKEIKPRDYKAESVLYFQKGDAVYNALSDKVMNLFNLEYVQEAEVIPFLSREQETTKKAA